jgi:hypothetical protein
MTPKILERHGKNTPLQVPNRRGGVVDLVLALAAVEMEDMSETVAMVLTEDESSPPLVLPLSCS